MKNNFDFKNVRGIIFDMDGVLLDTETICDKCWQIAGAEFGLDNIESATEICRGKSRKDTVSTLQELYHAKPNFDVEAFMARSNEIFTYIENHEGIKNMYFAQNALEYLSAHYKIALASSTRHEKVIPQLTNAHLIQYFSSIISGDSVKHSKPDPEIYIKAYENLGFAPQECLAVEDSPNGILSAYSARVPVVMIPDKTPCNEKLAKMIVGVFKNLEEFCKAFS